MVGGELGVNVIVEPLGKVATFREAPPAGPPVHSTLREIVLPSAEKVLSDGDCARYMLSSVKLD